MVREKTIERYSLLKKKDIEMLKRMSPELGKSVEEYYNSVEGRAYRYTRNFLLSLVIFAYGYVFSNIGFRAMNVCRNRSALSEADFYASESEMRADFNKQKQKIGIEDKIIELAVVENLFPPADCDKNYDGSFIIRINPEYKTPFLLRHELYHVKEDSFGQSKARFTREYEEWCATSYALKEN